MDDYSLDKVRVMNNTSHTHCNNKMALMIAVIILILTSCSAQEGELRNQTTGKILIDQEKDFILTTDDITQVDFANFTFPVSPGRKNLLPLATVRVVNREYRYKEDSGKRVEFYQNKNIIFDNVTGKDLKKDAVVVFMIVSGESGTIGTGKEHSIYIYSIFDKQLKLIWCIDTGDRSVGGLRDVYGEDGNLIVETYNSDVYFDSQGNAVPGASCCSKTYTRAVYQWIGFRYQLIEAKRYDNPLNSATLLIDNRRRNK